MIRKPGPRGQDLLNQYEERRLQQQRESSLFDFGRLGVDDEPVIRCGVARCGRAAVLWMRRVDGRESLRCGQHGLANVTTQRREIDPFDWHSLPADPFTRNENV